MKYNIGDSIVIKNYEDLPEGIRNKANGRACGKKGEIVDIYYSKALQKELYEIHFQGKPLPSVVAWTEDCFAEEGPDKSEYSIELTCEDNLIIARMFSGEEKKLIGQGHGHIFHDGALGIAQAASYAAKKMYENMGGDFRKKAHYEDDTM